MKSFRISAAAAAAALSVLMSHPPAVTAREATLTVSQAVAAAMAGNDMVGAGEARLSAADGDVGAARSAFLPRIAFEEKFLRTDNPAYVFSSKINQGEFTGADLAGAPGSFNDPEAVGDFTTSLTFRQALYSRRASLGLEMSKEEREAAAMDQRRLREETAFEAYRAFIGALAAGAYLSTAISSEEDAREHLRLATLMEEAEVGVLADRLRAEVALGEARRMRLKVENDVEIARRGLGLVIGRDDAVTPVEGGLLEETGGLDPLVESVEKRSDIAAMRIRVENGGRSVDLERAGRRPEVGLFGFLQADDPDMVFGSRGTSYGAGVSLTWSIFDGKLSRSRQHKAEAGLEAATRLLEGMKKEARYRVREAYLRVGEARQGLDIAEKALRSAEEGVRLVRLRYENGLSGIVALLDAQAALDRARSDAVRIRMELYGAVAELKHRAGTLLEEIGPEERGGGAVDAGNERDDQSDAAGTGA